MTRSLLVLAKIFSSRAVLLQKRPFLTPGLQPPDDTVARRPALRSSTHQKVWEMGMTSWASDTRGLLREQSHSSSQVQKKRHLEKQYRGEPGREIWATTASHGAFLLSNRTTALLRTVPQMAYFFFFLEVLNLEDLNQRRSLADARERKHKLNQMAFTRPCKCRCCNRDAQRRNPATTHGSSVPVPTTASSCRKNYAFCDQYIRSPNNILCY